MSFVQSAAAKRREGNQQQQQQVQTLKKKTREEYEAQTLQSLQNSLRTAGDTQQVADATATKLNEQTEQLERIRETADDVAHNLDTSQHVLNGMKSWWGTISNTWKRAPLPREGRLPPPASSTVPRPGSGPGASSTPSQSQSKTQLKPLPGASLPKSQFDQELDKGLDQLENMIGELHVRSVDINHTLKYQNGLVDDVAQRVENNSAKLAKQQRDIDKLMKR